MSEIEQPIRSRVFKDPKDKFETIKTDPFKGYQFSSDDANKVSFLELFKLKVGNIYGLQETVLNRGTDNKPTSAILVSEGAECLVINKRYFMKFLAPRSLIKLRFLITPYPSDNKMVKKYFNEFEWKDFKTKCFSKTYKKVKRENELKSASVFNF